MSKLANISKQRIDPIVNAENEHEKRALNCRLSPLAEFVIENVQLQLGVSFTAAGSQLLEAACADWLEINGHDVTSEPFKSKYLQWLRSFHELHYEYPDPETGSDEKTRTYVTL
jgi:hypothetical protein